MYKNPQRTFSGGSDLFAEPLTPPANSRAQRKNGAEEPSEISPGLLDLHAFDTELIPEVSFLHFTLKNVILFSSFS